MTTIEYTINPFYGTDKPIRLMLMILGMDRFVCATEVGKVSEKPLLLRVGASKIG